MSCNGDGSALFEVAAARASLYPRRSSRQVGLGTKVSIRLDKQWQYICSKG